jgi:hypothetical protein
MDCRSLRLEELTEEQEWAAEHVGGPGVRHRRGGHQEDRLRLGVRPAPKQVGRVNHQKTESILAPSRMSSGWISSRQKGCLFIAQ